MEEGDLTTTMLFTFNEEDLIHTVRADVRGRAVGDDVVPTPWQKAYSCELRSIKIKRKGS
jgi:hypothetical protein